YANWRRAASKGSRLSFLRAVSSGDPRRREADNLAEKSSNSPCTTAKVGVGCSKCTLSVMAPITVAAVTMSSSSFIRVKPTSALNLVAIFFLLCSPREIEQYKRKKQATHK